MSKNLAQGVAEQFKVWGVETVYGVAGDDLLPFLAALKEQKISFIGATHEAGAAFMAAYQARLTEKLAVCVASGAGAINLLEGLAEASLDGLPVLALTGQVAKKQMGLSIPQYYQQQSLFKTFARYSEVLQESGQAQDLLLMSISRALLGKNLAHLTIPQNLWLEPIQWQEKPWPPLLTSPQNAAREGDLVGILRQMGQARKPLIVLGSGAKDLAGQVKELAHCWGAGIIVALDAKGKIPDQWWEVLGGIGEAWLPQGIGETDYILLIGSVGYEEPFFPAIPVVQVVSSPWEVGINYLGTSLAGNLSEILQDLIDGLREYNPSTSWQQVCQGDRRNWEASWQANLADEDFPWHPATLMTTLSSVVTDDAIIVLDTGAFNRWFNSNFEAKRQKVLVSARWRSMGAALPGALAAQHCYPDRQVLAIVGDGGFLMSLGELATAVEYQLPIKVIVVNNKGYGLEKDKARLEQLNPPGLKLPQVDFAKVAQGFGIKGYRIAEGSLSQGLQEALSNPDLAVIDVPCREVALPHLRMQ